VQIYGDYANLSILQTYASPQVNQSSNGVGAVRDAIAVINQSELLGFDRELRFSRDPQSGLGIVQVLNRTTGQVILQLPSEFILNLAQNLQKGN
jgi:uncharacterized FlaG/YvyC family protein